MNPNIKTTLHTHCTTAIQQQITTAQNAIAAAEESRDNETKSSVGDKYETGRAMMQNEIAKSQTQLAQALQLKAQLSQLDPNKINETAVKGSLIYTNHGNFYISIGLGKVNLEEGLFYVISLDSPIGKVLINKKTGDTVPFQNRKYVIKEII